MAHDSDRPPTAVPTRIGVAGLLGAACAYAAILLLRTPALLSIFLLLAACAGPMWWLEYRRRARDGAPPVYAAAEHAPRAHRVLGILSVGALFAATISLQLLLAPTWTAGLYDLILPMTALAAAWCTWQLFGADDVPTAVDSLGSTVIQALRLRFSAPGTQCLLSWLVKAFFLPLMLAWSYTWLAQAADLPTGNNRLLAFFGATMALMYAVDTAFATVGYISMSPRIGAEVRSVDATWLGWLSALACYPPLSALVLRQWLDYKDGLEWQTWLQGHPGVTLVWAAAILLLTGIYTWATVAFGPRFSNLTHRGILTSGPYRYTKHPAYLCKNLSWWLISVPFVSSAGTWSAITNCLALVGVNVIYWLRARTEERHLMKDETYRHYAAWIARHGLFARCLRLGRPAR